MSRTRHPLPPGDVRLLAACSHLGFYLGFFYLVWMEIGSRIFASYEPLFVGEWSGAAIPVAVVVVFFAPPAAALWASRTSPWRGFLRSHGFRAMVFHAAGMLGIWLATAGASKIQSPEIVVVIVSCFLAFLGMAWLYLPVSAAFRAREGDLAWYPWVHQLFPDPPEPGWRTPLPPGSP